MAMADVYKPGELKIPSKNVMSSYFPSLPPKPPRAAMCYSRSVIEAPQTALMGVVVDARQPNQYPVTLRCRMRNQVGYTNRWRMPQSLGSDLLGMSQALKAVNEPCSESVLHVLNAASHIRTTKPDSEEPPRKLPSMCSDPRPLTMPMPEASSQCASKLTRSKTLPPCLPSHPTKHKGEEKAQGDIFPGANRSRQPKHLFDYHSKRCQKPNSSDVLLQCLGVNWELHRPFVCKAQALADLLQNQAADCGAQPAAASLSRQAAGESAARPRDASEALPGGAPHADQDKDDAQIILKLDPEEDSLVTQQALAVALGNMYHEEAEMEVQDAAGVFAAASLLRFKALQQGCVRLMRRTISHKTVCPYHHVAEKYQQDELRTACERWLELNLVTKMSGRIQLRDVPISLLNKVLKSNRLFTYGEYSLYKVLATWIFLQMNPSLQLMTAYNTVLTFFNSLPKSSPLLEQEEGQGYHALVNTLRLHGITDTNHLQDIQTMNILPQAWVVKVLAQHYHSLNTGGDMSLLTNFNSGAVRQGFILDGDPHYHSEILSLYGFHFELKALHQIKDNSYGFYMQRLKPNDPILSLRQCERYTFSMRSERDVKYSIRVQWFDKDGQSQTHTTGMLVQRFGLGPKTSRSRMVSLEKLKTPVYVSFSVLFPPS